MAQTLLAFLLVNSSAKGPNLVFRWPPNPQTTSRLSRPLPHEDRLELDNPWRAANHNDSPQISVEASGEAMATAAEDYQWKSPSVIRDRSRSFPRSGSLPTSAVNALPEEHFFDDEELAEDPTDEYHRIFDYSTQFLAGMLCPKTSLCHQKFDLVIDNLLFIGHPVCIEDGGHWQFKRDKSSSGSRGRSSVNHESMDDIKSDTSIRAYSPTGKNENSWLHMFHFVLVLDLPDPSSSASGNISKYFDTIYKQIAFTITAVLFQEQVLSNFVELECDVLGSLEAEYIAKGEPFSAFMSQALQISSVASAMKALFDAIKSSTMAYITLNDIPLELQLPPFLDHLLHGEEEHELDFVDHQEDEDEARVWGCDLSLGWRLPSLAPWKSLLLLEGDQELDPYINLRGPHVRPDEREHAEGLIRFLETASVTLSLSDMANLLEWDLETQIYPTVRWLVHHRRAKVVDTIHLGLKTIFTIPPIFDAPLSTLSAEFKRDFPQPEIPPLPSLLASISEASSRQSDNHFFAVVVRSKELIPLYHEVVIWLLKRDMLYTLHLRIRIVATAELKARVRRAHERKLERSMGQRRQDRVGSGLRPRDQDPAFYEVNARRPGSTWFPLSPRGVHPFSRRMPSAESESGRTNETSLSHVDEDDEEAITDESDDGNIAWGSPENTLCPSLISDPGTASPLERKWLAAMSEGKDEHIARRFEQINQYFDGKSTDDEILHRAEISRKQLREVLHHYDEYLQTFLHPA
ncbi:nitrogen permease regulator of amino acid transport activity 3-domain-containing protein [Pisolithus thermaeus]|nr:nitrogen permease regulator of amino acid transport activity 3-domain-containing protein [Pisolithus thermaeus]